MEPIKIDLTDLTESDIQTCLPNRGNCYYKAPCIIGTLVKPELRHILDEADLDGTSVEELIDGGYLKLPPQQELAAHNLQRMFDSPDKFTEDAFLAAAREWARKP